jgi:filamentous hemagglutinin family protein
MNSISKNILLLIAIIVPFEANVSNAQINPDASLGSNNSIVSNGVNNGVNVKILSGGKTVGANLFHSFKDFNVNYGESSYFQSPTGIQNIITRITGTDISNIDGNLGILGNANLFLINPNGIIFGSNAKLDLNGSFLATTADYFIFNEGNRYSAKNPEEPSLLQMNVPQGLVFIESKGTIQVQGSGHNIISPGSTILPFTSNGAIPTGLSVKQGKTFALIGGNSVDFLGGIVTVPSGQIDIAAIHSGEVGIQSNPHNALTLSYNNVSSRGDILLDRVSLLNDTGFGSGNIHLFGKNIRLENSSLVLIKNVGSSPSGSLTVDASNDLSVSGSGVFSPAYPLPAAAASGLRTQAFGAGAGADINIFAKNLIVDDYGRIFSQSFGAGRGGNTTLNISESTSLPENSNEITYGLGSIIGSSGAGTVNAGGAGNVTLNTPILAIYGGSQISSTALQKANGGTVIINADTINIDGFNKYSLIASGIYSTNFGAGIGSNATINAAKINIANGGRLDTSTYASGSGGDLVVNATKSIDISGKIPGSINPTLISASANLADPSIQKALGLPAIPTGSAGNLTITTPILIAYDGAEITVRADGPGKAGKLSLTTQKTQLQDVKITASTQGGDGGSINLTTSKLVMQNSIISASAKGNGNGGNLFLNSYVVLGDSSSYFSANSESGSGGQIIVNSKGFIFPSLNISAISTSGTNKNGTVQVNATSTRLNLLNSYKASPVRYSFSTSCKPSQDKSLSSNNGSGVTPEELTEPVENLVSSKNVYYRLDLKTRQKIPMGDAMLTWRDIGGGNGSATSEMSDPTSVISFFHIHCIDSSPVSSAKIK